MSITIKQRLVADAGKPGEICENASISLSGKITGGSGYGTWSGGLGKYSPSDSSLITQYIPTAAEILAGKITFSLVTKSLGTCLGDTSMVTFIIHPNPVIQFSVDTAKACAPHCVDFTDNTAAGNTSINKWEWKFGEGMADQTKKNPKDVCFSKPGLYDVQLTATSSKNCISTLLKQSYIETYKQPKAAFIATPNPVSQFEPTIHFYNKSSADVKTWFWSLGDGTIISPSTKDPIHQYEVGVANVYNVWLVVKNAYGCMDSTSQAVEVQPEFTFFMPNAFTPSMDNDGINDTFFGKGRGIVDYKLWIFDRWGNMLFTAEDIDKGWDGRVKEKGGIALQDVYCWKVKLKDVFGNKHEYIGTVTLLQK